MDVTADIMKAKDLLDKAKNVLVVTHEHPNFDSIGSALALSLGLTGMGKKVTVVCPDPMTVELSGFVGVQKIQREIANKNFVISLDYVEGSIDKVSYNIEGNTFNLVIEPRAGFDGFSEDKVHFSRGAAAADCIFTVDTIHVGGLKDVYEKNKDLFGAKPVINIDRHPNNAKYGTINLVDAASVATVEIVSRFLSHIGVALTTDIATNVVNALYGATNNFANPNVTAQAFELAAACLRAGGKRFTKSATPQEEVPVGESVAEKTPAPVEVKQATPSTATTTPPDWLKPKIFKSSNLI